MSFYSIGPLTLSAGGFKFGASAAPLSRSTPNINFCSNYVKSTATSGDARGLYNRLWISGIGGGGDAARLFATVDNVVATTVRGAHISLSQGATGSVSGLGAALEATLHINNSGSAAGTLYGVKSAFNSDGAASDPAGATTLAYYAAVNQGDATGGADVDDDACLFDIQGHTIGAGNMIFASATLAATHVCKIKIGATLFYILLTNSPA